MENENSHKLFFIYFSSSSPASTDGLRSDIGPAVPEMQHQPRRSGDRARVTLYFLKQSLSINQVDALSPLCIYSFKISDTTFVQLNLTDSSLICTSFLNKNALPLFAMNVFSGLSSAQLFPIPRVNAAPAMKGIASGTL